jgi:hypothetical protein
MLTGLLKDRPTLREMLDLLSDRYDMSFRIDESAFTKAGRDVSKARPQSDLLDEVNLNTVLHSLLESVDATFELRQRTIWIVPSPRPQSLAERLPPPDAHFLGGFYALINVQPGIPKGTFLPKALERFQMRIFIDHRAFERAGIKDIDQRSVQLAEKVDVRLSAVLRELCQQTGTDFVVRDHIVLIVPSRK